VRLAQDRKLDADARTLYVNRPLVNADALLAWARRVGFKSTLPIGDVHATVAFSKEPVNWSDVEPQLDGLSVPAGGERSVERLGDKGAVVLRFESPELTKRWHQFRGIGASWDWPGYKPHVTITYDFGAGRIDLSAIEPYDGPLDFGPEVFAEVDSGWADKVKKNLAGDELIEIDVDDEEGQLAKLLAYIRANSEVGHSFDIVVDPSDPELAKKFYIDGDGAFRIRKIKVDGMAGDSALRLALDRESVRTKDRDGRLRVARTHISKANVCPYKGSEIPGYEELGLEPNRIYQLLRDPEELAKAAPTLNGVPLLRKHIPVSAEDHQPDDVVGSLGTDADFDGEYLDNSVFVNAREAIDGIESGKKRELSAGYHYRPDMTPGNFRGKAFDGVMRDIVFNHVALVEDGRVGPDVLVGDSTENLPMKTTRIAALALRSVAAYTAPLLAFDAKITLPKDLFTPLTSKNFKEHTPKIVAGVKLAIDGKLRKGMAFDDGGLTKLLAALEDTATGVDEPADKDVVEKMDDLAAVEPIKAEEAVVEKKPGAFDAEAVKTFCREKGMSEDDITALSGMFPQAAGADEFPPKKEDDDEAKKKADEDEKKAKDAAMKDMVTKPAMDEAIKKASADTEARVVARERGIRTAIADVKPWVGELAPSLAFDSAEAVHRHVAKAMGIANADKLHADALLPVIQAQPKPGARPANNEPLAMDASAVADFSKRYPDADRIRAA
jgi:hypothetical protein